MDNFQNALFLAGEIAENFTFSHACRQMRFTRTMLAVKRESGAQDVLPVISASGMLPEQTAVGTRVAVHGQVRAYSMRDENASHLMIVAYAQGVSPHEGPHENAVTLSGVLCRPPVYRVTPMGREIADLFIAVERAFGKSDYLPVIAWGGNARRVERWAPGTRVAVQGRLQSRIYQKRQPDGTAREMTAYEISASSVDVLV